MDTIEDEKAYIISICNKTDDASSSTSTSISRVPNQLLEVNAKAYEPAVLAIGPYHDRETPALKGLESHKRRYLKEFLEKDANKATEYVKTMREMKEKFYSFYSEFKLENESKPEEFLEMMILDCFFIFELIRKFIDSALQRKGNDPSTRSPCFLPPLELLELDPGLQEERNDPFSSDPLFASLNLRGILRDMLLFENQLPFFMLENLFQKTRTGEEPTCFIAFLSVYDTKKIQLDCFKTMAIMFTNYHLSRFGNIPFEEDIKDMGFAHLLGLLHTAWRPSYYKQLKCWRPPELNYPGATELRDSAGVKFRKVERLGKQRSLFDVRFNYEDGTFEIPVISIDEETETLLRNLMAYEQLTQGVGPKYVAHYIFLMNSLIKSPKDVELLCDRGIINGVGYEHGAIAQFFVNLAVNIVDSTSLDFFYTVVCVDLEVYCQRTRNKLKAWWDSSMLVLRRDYFNSPWALISFVAAFVLLVLTVIQTIYSIASYYK